MDGGGFPTQDETSPDDSQDPQPTALIVDFQTTLGDFSVTLDEQAAPITVENFLSYVDEGFYDGQDAQSETTFHRIIDGFVVQGGEFTPEGTLKATARPIALESDNGLSNIRGTIAMARTMTPDSATSQFYVNLVDNTALDYLDEENPGYAVFGAVTAGMDTIDAIASVNTNDDAQPLEDVIITSCQRSPDSAR